MPCIILGSCHDVVYIDELYDHCYDDISEYDNDDSDDEYNTNDVVVKFVIQ
jgi:hypothetical protein